VVEQRITYQQPQTLHEFNHTTQFYYLVHIGSLYTYHEHELIKFIKKFIHDLFILLHLGIKF
jgi:hypothetical protein